MKARVVMDLEMDDNIPGSEIAERVAEGMTSRETEGFKFCAVKEIWRSLSSEFPRDSTTLLCTETFFASHSNSVGGTVVREIHEFVNGHKYLVQSWRPEGATVDGFFVFHKNAKKFSAVL